MSTTPMLESFEEVREDREENHTLELPSGRIIGYARYGAATTKHPTAFYLHGYPSSRLEAALYSRKLLSYGLRVISLDRPGFGLSTPVDQPFERRTILDHVQDIEAVADHLSIDKFYILGISGGAPYAYACAYRIPDRLLGVGILSGFGPWEFAASKKVWPKLWWLNKMGLVLPVKIPWLYEKLYNLLVPIFVNRMTKTTWEQLQESKSFKKAAETSEDVKLMLEGGPEMYNDTIHTTKEAIRQKEFARCHVEEARLLAKPWPFKLSDISLSNMKLWYGTKDINTPPELGEMIYEALGNRHVEFKTFEDGTHASVMAQGPDMLREFIGLESAV